MSAFVSSKNEAGLCRVVLSELKAEGVYAFGFESADSPGPEWDYLQDTLDDAKEFCLERWGVPLDSWAPTTEWPNLR